MSTTGLAMRLLLVGAVLALARLAPPHQAEPEPFTVTADGARHAAGGRLTVRDGWALLTLVGSPAEMGAQQGRLLAPELRGLFATTLEPTLRAAGVSGNERQRFAGALLAALPADQRAEMSALAAGAALPLDDVVLWNGLETLLALGEDRAAALAPVAAPLPVVGSDAGLLGRVDRAVAGDWPPALDSPDEAPATLALAAWGRETVGGRLWGGALLAAGPGAGRPLLVVRQPRAGLANAGVALPGEVGLRAGLNGAGLFLVAFPMPSIDVAVDGLPAPLLLAHTLARAESAEGAARAIAATRRSGGAQWLAADGGMAVALETGARQLATRPTTDHDWAVVASHPGAAAALGPWLRANGGWLDGPALLVRLTQVEEAGGWVRLLAAPATGDLWLAQPAGGHPAPASGFTQLTLAELFASANDE